MKYQHASIQDTGNRIPLIEEALLKQLNEEQVEGLPRVAANQPSKVSDEKKPKDNVVLDKRGINKLQQATIFEGLSESQLSYLLSNSVIHSVPAEEKLVEHGGMVKYLYLIIEGGVKVFRSSQEGKEAPISILKAGETFMESVLFMNGVSPVSAETMKRSKLLLIPAEIVKQQIAKGGQLSKNILDIVCRRYKSAVQQVDSIVTKTPFERLGNYFLKLKVDQNPDSLTIDLHCQKSMIANHLGMKPETFSRTLKKLNEKGVEVSFKYITLKESNVLCEFCDNDISSNCPRFGTSKCSFSNGLRK